MVELITSVSSKFQKNLSSFSLIIFPTSQLHLHAFFCHYSTSFDKDTKII